MSDDENQPKTSKNAKKKIHKKYTKRTNKSSINNRSTWVMAKHIIRITRGRFWRSGRATASGSRRHGFDSYRKISFSSIKDPFIINI